MRHKADVHRLRGTGHIILLYDLRLRDRLCLDGHSRRFTFVCFIQISIQHFERFTDILLSRRIYQHIGWAVIGVVYPHDVLIGQVKQLRYRAAGIKCCWGVAIEVFIQLIGYKI